MPFVKITGTGSHVPEKILTNFDLEKMVETNDQWIRERTGIKTRHIADENTTSSDLAVKAGQEALKKANKTVSDIDLILVATTTPDHPVFPSNGCVIQRKLGAEKIPAFDISAACSGFIYGLSVAYSYIHAGLFKNILFISVDTLSKNLNWEDRGTCILFGDGAGALFLESSDDPQDESILSFDMHANGQGNDMLIVPGGGSKTPFSNEVLENKMQYIQMDGPAVFKFAVNVIIDSLTTALDKASLKKEDITYFVPHQANSRIIDFATKKLSLKPEQVKMNLDRYGNTSAASIPILLDELNNENQLKKGDIIATVGFGAGLTWGSSIIKW